MQRSQVPAYCKHASGQAYVRIKQPDGTRKTVYLGVHGTAESRRAYARLIAGLKDNEPAGAILGVTVE